MNPMCPSRNAAKPDDESIDRWQQSHVADQTQRQGDHRDDRRRVVTAGQRGDGDRADRRQRLGDQFDAVSVRPTGVPVGHRRCGGRDESDDHWELHVRPGH